MPQDAPDSCPRSEHGTAPIVYAPTPDHTIRLHQTLDLRTDQIREQHPIITALHAF
jgi:hypothetical protein